MYIKFEKKELSNYLKEKRPGMIFSNPDIFIVFDGQRRFVIWGEVIDNLSGHWLDDKDLWDSEFDFSDNPDDYDLQFDDYKTVELLQFPQYEDSNTEDEHAFIFDKDKVLYININFINDLKSAGAKDIWYDTTAPYGRY